MSELTYHEIRSLQDPHYDDWLDLYQASFPLTEQVQISSLNRDAACRAGCPVVISLFGGSGSHGGETAALALYDDDAGDGAAALWYIAVTPDRRSPRSGNGSFTGKSGGVLRCILVCARFFWRLKTRKPALRQKSGILPSAGSSFYRRHGALRLGGAAYIQSVGWQPPLPMLLMVDLLAEMPPDEVRALAQAVFGEAVQPQGRAELL